MNGRKRESTESQSPGTRANSVHPQPILGECTHAPPGLKTRSDESDLSDKSDSTNPNVLKPLSISPDNTAVIRETCTPSTFFKFTIPRNRHASQVVAIGKRPLPNTRHAIRNRYTSQVGTTGKRPLSNTRHTIRNRHTTQVGTIGKRKITNTRHAFRNCVRCNIFGYIN